TDPKYRMSFCSPTTGSGLPSTFASNNASCTIFFTAAIDNTSALDGGHDLTEHRPKMQGSDRSASGNSAFRDFRGPDPGPSSSARLDVHAERHPAIRRGARKEVRVVMVVGDTHHLHGRDTA